jgi:hypothetical protein
LVGREHINRFSERQAVHDFPALVVDIDTIAKAELSVPKVPAHAVARRSKGDAPHCVCLHLRTIGVEKHIRAVNQMHK